MTRIFLALVVTAIGFVALCGAQSNDEILNLCSANYKIRRAKPKDRQDIAKELLDAQARPLEKDLPVTIIEVLELDLSDLQRRVIDVNKEITAALTADSEAYPWLGDQKRVNVLDPIWGVLLNVAYGKDAHEFAGMFKDQNVNSYGPLCRGRLTRAFAWKVRNVIPESTSFETLRDPLARLVERMNSDTSLYVRIESCNALLQACKKNGTSSLAREDLVRIHEAATVIGSKYETLTEDARNDLVRQLGIDFAAKAFDYESDAGALSKLESIGVDLYPGSPVDPPWRLIKSCIVIPAPEASRFYLVGVALLVAYLMFSALCWVKMQPLIKQESILTSAVLLLFGPIVLLRVAFLYWASG